MQYCDTLPNHVGLDGIYNPPSKYTALNKIIMQSIVCFSTGLFNFGWKLGLLMKELRNFVVGRPLCGWVLLSKEEKINTLDIPH